MAAEFIELASAAVKLVVAAIGLVMSTLVLPWLRDEAIPWLQEKRLYATVLTFVRAAEKMCEAGNLEGRKKAYVISLLKERGVEITPEVDAYIESAVKELDIAVDSSISGIVDSMENICDEKAEVEANGEL